ncbi:membrane-anchored mycosin [Mycobacterium haemophilum DSM 44634]|uniref:type VII secretion-associated serine protease mycosin n=1 Tax=Mycobacterium haemophilum TaxID=29311 RepID=UPI0006561DA9|nr:type VII secretion-associated serine protease mycosin [Mycobacterium haemophilum]AKN18085.1 type VII secretion-associated serine protease mycosin [Mycobacterium haemophilum DSM 44634]MCV7340902.1 type VII secretion-associated serine protease mycosin [Mycobacterium haemophilum DSM 44634]
MITTRIVRVLAVAALTGVAQFGTPLAHGVSPPPIDDRWLPKPVKPTPPQPTAQREVCAVVPENSGPADNQLAALDLPQVWQLTRGAGQRVAVIDTGISRHRRLSQLVPGGDYVFTGDGTQDCDAHGTLVAGIIAAAPDSKPGGFSGVAPDVTLISIRQSSAKFAPLRSRSSTGVGDVDTMAKAVRTAADLGASVINISSVACVPAASTLDDRALGAALAYAVDVKNAVVVAPAGNTAGNAGGATRCPAQRPGATWQTTTVAVSPAWYDEYVLTVGSVTADGAPSAFTLAGPWVDVAATGEGMTSLGTTPLSGTSYAAPIVSGLAALVRARFPALTARQVMQRIESTAHHPPPGWDPFVGHGTVDPLAAVSTDSTPPASGSQSSPPPVPISAPPPRPTDHHDENTAFGGAAICLAALLAAVASLLLRRSRRDDVATD